MFRLLQAAAFGVAGFVLVNANSYDLLDIAKTLAGTGSRHVREFNRFDGALIYALQLPAILSTPVVILLIAAVGLAWRHWRQHGTPSRLWAWSLAVILPNIVLAIVVLSGTNNFPRHLLPFIPWAAIAAAYALVTLSRSIQRPTVRRTVVALFYAYLAVFVWDGERVFIKDPRNAAANWMRANVAEGTTIWWQGHGWIGEYKHVVFPSQGRPDVLVMELHRANIYLSGMGWKNSMPTNVKQVYGAGTQADLETLQAVFRHTSEYQEVARFKEGYLMPEFRITDALLGNRARNYVGEIVIFRKSS
jgi:hypothetical protein